jgi:hypothetical protein
LRDRAFSDERLGALLDELASLTARERAPFFGGLLELAAAARTGVAPRDLLQRALLALADAHGPSALEEAVASLELDDADARTSAVEMLRRAAAIEPARWAHAIFHPSEAVRAEAIARPPEGKARELELYALADPAVRDVLLARVSDVPLPSGSLPAVLELVRGGAFPADVARARIASEGASVVAWAEASRARSEAVVDALLSPASGAPDLAALDASPDDLDDLFALYWGEPDHPSTIAFFAHLRDAARASNVARRAVASALRCALATGRHVPRAMDLAVDLHPATIGLEWLPYEARRAALGALYARAGRGLSAWAPDLVEPLLWLPMCVHPDGGPDLQVIGALLQLVADPYRTLLKWLGASGFSIIPKALAARPAQSVGILFCDDGDEMKRAILAKVADANVRDELCALFAEHAPPSQLALLASLHQDAMMRIVERLVERGIGVERGDRIADALARKLSGAAIVVSLLGWRGPNDGATDFGSRMLAAVARALPADDWADAAVASRFLDHVLQAIDRFSGFPYAKEMVLARRLLGLDAATPAQRAWAERRVPSAAPEPVAARALPSDALARTLASCGEADLATHVRPFVDGLAKGLAPALAARRDPVVPNVAVCVALLGTPDAIGETDAQLARFFAHDPAFVHALDVAMVAAYQHRKTPLSPLGHAWLWRWDRHALAHLDALLAEHDDLARGFAARAVLRAPAMARECAAAIASAIAVLAARDRARFRTLANEALLDALIAHLAGDSGRHAADALRAIFHSRELALAMDERKARVRLLLPELDDATREHLRAWVDAAGVEPRRAPRVREPDLEKELAAQIRASSDRDALATLATSERVAIVHEATLRLVELGESGTERLAQLLEHAASTLAPVARVRPILESIALWSLGPSLDRTRAIANGTAGVPELRFRAAAAFVERREDAIGAALAAACAEDDERWFRPEDWERFVAIGVDVDAMAIGLAASPHPHAHLRAVSHLLTLEARPERLAALVAFLEAGTQRMASLRRSAAAFLHAHGEHIAFSLLVAQSLETTSHDSTLFARVPADLVLDATSSFLAAGKTIAKEPSLLLHLAPLSVDPFAREDAYERILVGSANDQVRTRVAQALRRGLRRAQKLRSVARTFAWGVRLGRELTGRVFQVQMTGGGDLGYTRMRESRVHVSALPLLRGDRHGRDVVEALILHELGHHMYHRGEDAEAIWKEAESEGIRGLLNLVADEHLERNLRALDAEFGDRLKRLAAFAFQHAAREVRVEELLRHLQARAFDVLSATSLGVARHPESVRVDAGALLFAMERARLAFSRFVRALRMGLGNRHDDPKVEAGLALFRGGFRHSTMKELLEISRELRRIFGWETELVESFGPHESLEAAGPEDVIWGDGITQEDVDREVQRVLDPRKRDDTSGRDDAGSPWINVSVSEQFDKITQIERVPFDAAEFAPYARRVARPAAVMRRFLEELGLAPQPRRMRLRGQRLDAARVRALVLRGDPRALVAREREQRDDLFLGILIDCSGSMSTRDNIERAKLFAALLAQAARPLPGVDVRAFGFTDSIIFDCGDARRCAVHALEADGGNNDAAALFHAAGVARESRRKAKLLVMISDGLPTECSAAALKTLADYLTRRERILCAQVAVQPITEPCFVHYVVLEDENVETTVSKFGQVVMRLVRRAMAG